LRAFPLVLFSLLALGGCGPGNIQHPMLDPELELVRNPDNEQIVELMDLYVKALEARDFEKIRELVSPEYYENSGTTDRTEDDYGSQGVVHLLETVGSHVKDVRVEFKVHDIEVQGERGRVLFDYALTMLYDVGGQERWQTARDVNQLELKLEQGRWLIVAGL
jgi:hypothetical protein